MRPKLVKLAFQEDQQVDPSTQNKWPISAPELKIDAERVEEFQGTYKRRRLWACQDSLVQILQLLRMPAKNAPHSSNNQIQINSTTKGVTKIVVNKQLFRKISKISSSRLMILRWENCRQIFTRRSSSWKFNSKWRAWHTMETKSLNFPTSWVSTQ